MKQSKAQKDVSSACMNNVLSMYCTYLRYLYSTHIANVPTCLHECIQYILIRKGNECGCCREVLLKSEAISKKEVRNSEIQNWQEEKRKKEKTG